jgi:hypothetical protein
MNSNLLISNFSKITGGKYILNIARISGLLCKSNLFSFATKLRRRAMMSVLLILMLVFSILKTFAQDAKELGTTLSSMKASSDASIQSQAAHIESLIYYLQPKLYINNGVEKKYGEVSPVSVESDAQSVSNLNEVNSLFSQVELITIKLNSPEDLNFVLDISTLHSFVNLKYIQFLCNFNCAPSLINKLFLQKNNSGVTVYYNISIEN